MIFFGIYYIVRFRERKRTKSWFDRPRNIGMVLWVCSGFLVTALEALFSFIYNHQGFESEQVSTRLQEKENNEPSRIYITTSLPSLRTSLSTHS
jgi:hypothetical protein